MVAVGGRCGIRVGRLLVPLGARASLVCGDHPRDLAVVAIDAVQPPVEFTRVDDRVASGAEYPARVAGPIAYRRDHEHLVAPDNRARVRHPGQVERPEDVAAGADVPVGRQTGGFADPGGAGAAERRPVRARGSRRTGAHQRNNNEGGDARGQVERLQRTPRSSSVGNGGAERKCYTGAAPPGRRTRAAEPRTKSRRPVPPALPCKRSGSKLPQHPRGSVSNRDQEAERCAARILHSLSSWPSPPAP